MKRNLRLTINLFSSVLDARRLAMSRSRISLCPASVIRKRSSSPLPSVVSTRALVLEKFDGNDP